MTAASEEVPVLGIGREQSQLWTQFAMTLAGELRRRRLDQQRFAYSDAEHAARQHDLVERVADPAVRTMDDAERAAWDPPEQDTRRADGPNGSVVVSVAAVGDRWGLAAEAIDSDGRHTDTAYVSCVDEITAKRIADELLAGGPGSVERLQGFAALATERAVTARAGMAEPEEQRLARTADAVREVWDARLAGAVTSSEAFGALAWRLHELELRGYSMTEVLRRLDSRRLSHSDVRDPAALAEWFVEQMSEELDDVNPAIHVVNLDSEEDLEAAARRGADSVSDRTTRTGATETEPTATRQAPVGRAVVEPLLADALPPEVLQAVQRSRGYESAVGLLHEFYERGRAVDRLLVDLPVDKVAAAHDPGGYLAAVARRRAEQDRPQRTGVDRSGMAELVQRGFPRPVADRVVACPAWPALARQLAEWDRHGAPLADMMSELPAGRVYQARKPAAYTTSLLRKAFQEEQQARAREAGEEPAVERGPRRSTPQHDDRTAPGHGGDGADGVTDTSLRWTDELDATSAIDRVGIEATVGLGSPARNARVEQRLQAAEHEPSSHTAAAEGAEARAGAYDQDAGQDRARPDLPDTNPREDLAGAEDSVADEQLAAGERAAAAEERGEATAAAARAEVTYTPPTDASANLEGAAQKPSPRPAPLRVKEPTQDQRRRR